MKKLLVLLLALTLIGCSSNNNEEETVDIDNLSIVCPAGAPSLAFYGELNNDKFATSDAASIMPELKSDNGSDVIVIDTVNGIKTLVGGAPYKLAANITFGNFFIAATGNDEDNKMTEDDYIVLFSQGATPDLLFHYLYGNEYDSNIHYVAAVSDAAACLIKEINISDDERTIDEEPYVDYVMIAEPALTAALAQNESAYIYENIQNKYDLTTGHGLVQASVFVSNRLSDEQVNAYLDKLKNSITNLQNDSNVFVDAIADLADAEVKEIFGIPNAKIATIVLEKNSIGLGYKKAIDNKESIDEYISMFDLAETDERIYFK